MKDQIRSMLKSIGLAVNFVPRPARPERRDDRLGLSFYRTALGDVYLPTDAPDDLIAARMSRGALFEPEVIETALRFIRPGTTVLDVGSNFGQMAMAFARATGPQGRVYAFEAQARVFDILQRNIAANKLAQIEAVFGAVLDESGRVLHFPEPDWARFATYGSFNLPLDSNPDQAPGPTPGTPVTSLRIDDLAFERPVSFMKVDVQGCDLFAMRGAKDTIRQFQMPILFEFEQRFQVDYATTFQDYAEFVDQIGYRFAETVLDINFLILPK